MEEIKFKQDNSRAYKGLAFIAFLLAVFSVAAVVVLAAILKNELENNRILDEELASLAEKLKEEKDICDDQNTIDVAIVGAGASGTFSAWQLSRKHSNWTINIYDANNRVGGRLYSVRVPGIANHVADLGAMRFKTSHTRLQRVTSQLGLTVDNFTTPDMNNTLYFLRGTLLSRSDIETGNVPYAMTDYERNISGNTEALHAYWNKMILNNASLGESDPFLQVCKDGERAYEKGGYNAFGEVTSADAIEYVAYRDGFIGEYYNNMNYVWFSGTTDFTPEETPAPPDQYYTIKKGFQELPRMMAAKFLQNSQNSLNLYHTLKSVTYTNGIAHLTFYDSSRYEFVNVCAKKVILGISSEALKLIQLDKDFQMALAPLVNAVKTNPAGETYLAYDRPWWRNESQGPIFDELRQNGVGLKYIVTDTPAGTILDIGKDNNTGKALLLCYFDWWINIRFWEPYQDNENTHNSNLEADKKVSEMYFRELNRQLSLVFNISESKIPPAYATVTHSWFEAPYWTAWHDLNPGYNYPKVMQQIRKPVSNKNLFIVGEAYSDWQGWTEGALETAESVLSQYFGVTQF